MNNKNDCDEHCPAVKIADSVDSGRRGFLKASATGVATLMLGEVFPGRVLGQEETQTVEVTTYAKKTIARLADLIEDEPVMFDFPGEGLHSACMLVKLGRPAGGGIGDSQDIVAFSARCTHMGGDLKDGFVSEHKVIGCNEHLTTFDLTRHGIMVAGHATQSLPQIVIEIDGDDIVASRIAGLIYGYSSNPS